MLQTRFPFSEPTARDWRFPQADVGPFLPQRFQPPDYAWHHGARCYKQGVYQEMGVATFGETGQMYDTMAEPSAGPERLNAADGPLSEAALAWREKRAEFGLADEKQSAAHIEGQVQVPPAGGSSQPHDGPKAIEDGAAAAESSQPLTSWGQASSWWSQPTQSGGWSSGWQREEWWTPKRSDYGARGSSQPPAPYIPTPTIGGNIEYDHRGYKVHKIYGSGQKRP